MITILDKLFKGFFKKETPQINLLERYGKSAPLINKRDVINYYNRNPMLRACISKIAESISITDWAVYRNKRNGERERVYSHPLLDLLKNFNPLFSTGIDGWYTLQSHLELTGNAYLHKERNAKGQTIYLWLYNPNDVMELPSKQNDFVYKVKIGDIFYNIPMTEIIHIKNPNPNDIYGFGVGVAETLANELQITELSSKQLNQYFYNGAIPPYIVGADVSVDQLKEMKDKWIGENQGFFNRNKPYFTNTNNISIQKLTDSFRDMDLANLRSIDNDTIRKTFGIPPEIIGDVTNSNRATISGAREIYALEVLIPRLKKLKDIINTNLVTDYAENIEVEFISPVPSDKELVLRVIKEFRQAFELNEIREFVDFEPVSTLKGIYGEERESRDKQDNSVEREMNLDGSIRDSSE